MVSNLQVTPVPIPVQGNVQHIHSSTDYAASPVGPGSSTGEARKMKPTGAKVNVGRTSLPQAPPWATSLLTSKPSIWPSEAPSASDSGSLLDLNGNNSVLESPEPARIVSDIVPQADVDAATLENGTPDRSLQEMKIATDNTPLAKTARIQALQQVWMRNLGTETLDSMETAKNPLGSGLSLQDASPSPLSPSSSSSSSSAPSPSQPTRKRSLGAVQGSDPKRRLVEAIHGDSNRTRVALVSSNGASRLTSSSQVATQHTNALASSAKPGLIPIQRTAQAVEMTKEVPDDEDLDGVYITDGGYTTEDENFPEPASLQGVNVEQQGPPSGQVVSAACHPNVYMNVSTDYAAQYVGKPQEVDTTADSGRPYTLWKRPDGFLEPSCGALLPTGYHLWTDSDHPWICPVRDCRNIFKSIAGLGTHFGSRHKNTMFNDNLDGTLSGVGSFQVPGLTRSSSVIVSKNPLRGDEPPMPEPQTKTYKSVSGSNTNPLSLSCTVPKTLNASPSRSPSMHTHRHPPPASNITLYRYLTSCLSSSYVLPSERPDIKALLKLPIRRTLPEAWKVNHKGIGHLAPLAALSLLVFLTGDLASAPCATCRTAYGNKLDNPLRPCVVLSNTAPSWLKETVSEACACCQWNCNYKRLKNECEFLLNTRHQPSSLSARVETPIPPPIVPSAVACSIVPKNAKLPYNKPVPSSESSSAAGSSPNATYAAPAPRPSSPPRRVTRHSLVAKAAAMSASKPAPAPVVSATSEQTMPSEMLEMEDWEIAPGRVRDERSETPTNIAFSNAYLTSNQAVAVAEDVFFNVMVIKPGGSHQWTDEDDKLRICSLAVGKIKVKLDKTEPFSIGPNGMFKLKPGVACSIANRTYMDAVIHVTSLTRY